MQKNNSKIIIIIGSFLLIVLLAFIISYRASDNKDENNNPEPSNPVTNRDYLVINDYDVWEYRNNNWLNVKNFQNINNKFNIYVNKEYFGYYKMSYITSWSIFDDEDNFQEYSGSLVAFTDNLKINVKNYDKTKINEQDLAEINNILNTNVTINDLSTNEKVIIDLNNDGVNDKLINVANLDMAESDLYFNLIYAVIDNERVIIRNDNIPVTDILIVPSLSIINILNINNENLDSIILEEGYFSLSGETGAMMYQFKDGKYQKVVE